MRDASTSSSGSAAARAPQCRICGSYEVEDKGAKRGDFVAGDFHYYRCRGCEFLFVEPVTGPGIYDDSYYAGHGADPLVDYEAEYLHYSSSPRRFEFENLVELAVQHLGTPRKVLSEARRVDWLDFGSGAGGLLKYLRDLKVLDCAGASAFPFTRLGTTSAVTPNGCEERIASRYLSWISCAPVRKAVLTSLPASRSSNTGPIRGRRSSCSLIA